MKKSKFIKEEIIQSLRLLIRQAQRRVYEPALIANLQHAQERQANRCRRYTLWSMDLRRCAVRTTVNETRSDTDVRW